MKQKLEGHKMVRMGFDLVVIGGGWIISGVDWGYSKSLYKLTCYNKHCTWVELQQKLKIFRYAPVAFALPDDFFDCT